MPKSNEDKPLLYRPQRVYRMLSIGKTHGELLIAAGDLVAVPLGKRARGITAESVERVARQGVRCLGAEADPTD